MEQNNTLEERKKKILGYIESENYIPMKRKEIRQMLSVPDSDREIFEGLILELVNAGDRKSVV